MQPKSSARNPDHELITADDQPYLSVVVPIYNEKDGLPELHARLECAVQKLKVPYEILYVDDGSSDGTGDILRRINAVSENVKVITLLRNSGQAIALSAGFAHARGEIIMTMDGDGQMEPEDIPLLIAQIQEGNDVVSGWRVNRRDSWFSRALPSKLANLMIKKLTDIPFHDYGCSLKAYRRQLVDALHFDEYRTFNQAVLIAMAGRWAEVPVRHYARPYGSSKWTFFKLFQFNLDNLVSLSIHSFQRMAVFGVAISLIALFLTPLMFLFASRPNVSMPLLSLLMTMNLIGIGLIGVLIALAGEFVVRIFHVVDRRPKWVIREILEPQKFPNKAVVQTLVEVETRSADTLGVEQLKISEA